MSRRYWTQAECPNCKLLVQANGRGDLKSHSRRREAETSVTTDCPDRLDATSEQAP